MIAKITFEKILPIWQNYLWPGRTSKIESNSAMILLEGYDMYNMYTEPSFFAYVIDNDIVGVNSGHMCKNNQYRSRGLFVKEDFRKQGIGKQLLVATIEQGRNEGAELCWSYPRRTSWRTYESAGFKLITDWSESETSEANAYCTFKY